MKTETITKANREVITFDGLADCTICLKGLRPDEVWFADDSRDGRQFCEWCAPDTAIRFKDMI